MIGFSLRYLADGRVELGETKPTIVGVFYAHDLAEHMLGLLNSGGKDQIAPPELLRTATRAINQPTRDDMPEPAAVLPHDPIVIATMSAAEEECFVAAVKIAEAEASGSVDPTAEDWNVAFRVISSGESVKDVAEVLGVDYRKLRGKYAQWCKQKPSKSQSEAVAMPDASLPSSPQAPVVGNAKPLWWRQSEAMLNALGYNGDWSAKRDLSLVEGLAKGHHLTVVADELGVEVSVAKARFIALTPDGVTIKGQEQLLEVLRSRVA